MDYLDDFPAIGRAVIRYVPPAAMTAATKGFLDAAQIAASPAVRAVDTCEILYAARAQLDDAGRILCGQLAAFCASHDFHGMAQRGLAIATAMRRDLGEVPAGPGDPDPLETWAPGDAVAPAGEAEGAGA